MKIGFIGAGKVGCSLGKYFSIHDISLSGFFSRQEASAKEAATFTNSTYYSQLSALVADSDVIFVTVPDGTIASIWDSLKAYDLQGKCICHCSGSLSSGIFSDITHYGAFAYSIHPLYAVASKYHSYEDLSQTLFTIEGDEAHLEDMKTLMESLGNSVQLISKEQKAMYHAAAVFASNHVVALSKVAMDLLTQCGFSSENANQAIAPLLSGNVAHILKDGPTAALTGPVERNDCTTIQRHLNCLPEAYLPLYKELSKVLVDIGNEKHPDTDYGALLKLLT